MYRRQLFMQQLKNARLGFAAAAIAGLGLAACAGTDTAPARPCPEILIPVDSAKLTSFKPGPGRDIIDVVHEEQVTGFSHGCTYDTDETGAGMVVVELLPSFESTRGPANAQGQSQFEYYVAITDQDKNLIDKQRIPVTIEYPTNMSRLRWQREEPIVLNIPLKSGQTGEAYRVYLGLQLTRAELDYQRKVRSGSQ